MNKPKILFFDLENVQHPRNIFHPGKFGGAFGGARPAGFCANLAYILCMGYKFLDEDVHVVKKTRASFIADPLSDFEILQKCKEIIESADVIVGWNSSGHDLGFLQARLAQVGLSLDPGIKHIDLMKVAKRTLNLSNYGMTSVASFFGTMVKTDIDKMLWPLCWHGDYKALNTIADYCMDDVLVLESLYYKIRPLMSNHPYFKNTTEFRLCNTCGSDQLYGNGTRMTRTGKKQRYRCNSCGSATTGENVSV